MAENRYKTGLAAVNNARLYYEIAGAGEPFAMIHAAVADHRQWNNEFPFFSQRYQVLRYDLRGCGRSEPVEGEYSNLQDLVALLDSLHLEHPLILMGCSMGGGLALDFALTYPERVKALIMVSSGPSGLALDVPEWTAEFEAAQKSYDTGDLDRAAELMTHIWFDGIGRSPDQVNHSMRRLAYEMERNDLALEAKSLGKRLPDAPVLAVDRLNQLKMPLLIVVGAEDEPYALAAADYMVQRIPSARKVVIEDAAHLLNLDHPIEFQDIVSTFLVGIGA